MGPVRPQEDAAVAHPVADESRLGGGGLARVAIANEFHAEEQPRSPHVADDRMPAGERAQRPEEVLAHLEGVLLQPLLLHDVEHGSPTAADTGLPPNVLKNSMPLSNDEAISRVVTTAPIGWPLPSGLPITTMSGTTPWASNAQKCVPMRPRPVCTSSAMHTPPAACTAAYTSAR